MRALRPALRLTLVSALLVSSVPTLAASTRSTYERLLDHEKAVRTRLAAEHPSPAVLREARRIVAAYERLADAGRRTGYADNALWQAAALSADAWEQFSEDRDRAAALRLYRALVDRYPSSSLVKQARVEARRLDTGAPHARVAARDRAEAAAPRGTSGDSSQEERAIPVPPQALVKARDMTPPPAASSGAGAPPAAADAPVRIRKITRTTLGELVRVTIELDREVGYHEERIANPDRVFLDLQGATPGAVRRVQRFESGVVRQLRIGRREGPVTRVVLEIDGTATHSVFALYNPYRIVIDCQRPGADGGRVASAPATPVAAATQAPTADATVVPVVQAPKPPAPAPVARSAPARQPAPPAPLPDAVPAPAASSSAAANLHGRYSLSRQLGLGISRIVIDPGHGGHDPGAQVKGLNESDLVLDVALRLEQLLLAQPGVEVVMTRRTDVFIPLEERTAIANREGADLFLSIHANASRNRKARGIETYFLNFSSNAAAEAVAARENAASERTMHSLPDIVRAIALNDKVDESRDFATMVQRAMIEELRERDKSVRDLGVKQAPFVVLIGAAMPSILAEISFVTNPQEGKLLRSAAYRQHIAEALFEGVGRYERSLKSVRTVANQD